MTRMPDATLEITQQSMNQFQRALNRVATETKRTGREAVLFAAINLVISLRARSKDSRHAGRGKKFRPIVKNPDFIPFEKDINDESKGAEWFIVSHKQNKVKPVLIPTNNKQDPRRKIKNAGIMKSSWGWMLKSLNAPTGAIKNRKKAGITTVRKDLLGVEPEITLHNRIKYITLDQPRIAAESLMAASKNIEKKAKLQAQGIIKAWRR